MKEFIELLIVGCLFIQGLFFATDYNPMLDEAKDFDEARSLECYKNLLWPAKWLTKIIVGEYWIRPIFGCSSCMSSLWGTIIWFAAGGSAMQWVPFCVALCGLNTVINRLTDKFS